MSKVSRDYHLMSLQRGSNGIAILRCIAKDLGLEDAKRLVRCGLARPRDVLFAGHPAQFALWLDLHICEDNGWDRDDRQRLVDTATVWLHALRSCGALAFTSMAAGAVTTIDPCYGDIPPLLANYLHGLPPDVDLTGASLDPEGMTDTADARSTLGLLRERVDTKRLFAWMRGVGDQQRLACLRLPLFGQATEVELAAMHLRYAVWWQGPWYWMGMQSACFVHMVAVDPSGRLATATCTTDGMIAWSTDAMWAVLSNANDPPFDRHRDTAKADLLGMPGRMDLMWRSMLQHQLQPDAGIHAFPRNFHRAVESALREARFPLRVALLSALDMEAFDLADDMQQYNFLLGEGIVESKRNRCQAARAIPLLLGELTAGRAPKSRQAIDGGTPLFPAAAEDMGVSVWVAKRLPAIRAQLWHAVGLECSRDVRDLALLIEQCGAAAPRLDLSVIWGLQQLLGPIRELATGPEAQGLLRQLLLGMAGREAARAGWQSVISIMGLTSYVDMSRPAEFADGTDARRDLRDYFAYVLAAIGSVNQIPLARYHGDPQGLSARTTAALVELMAGLTLSDLQRLALRWHEALRHLDGAALQRRLNVALGGCADMTLQSSGSAPGRGTVEPVFAPCVLPCSGYHIEQLLDMEELRREGAEMRHCVVSYAGRAAGGQCLLVRLRHPDGIKRATLEFHYVVTMDGGKWKIEQAKGCRNQKPDDETSVAVMECLQYLNRITSELAPAQLARYAVAPSSESTGYPEFVVLETLMDSKRGRRWLPGPSSMSARERLQRAFEASAMPSRPVR